MEKVKDPRLGRVVVSLVDDHAERCGYCNQPLIDGVLITTPLVAYHPDRGIPVYMPSYHGPCGDVECWYSRLYGVKQALRFKTIKPTKKVKKSLDFYEEEFNKAYDNWIEWFHAQYGPDKLRELLRRP